MKKLINKPNSSLICLVERIFGLSINEAVYMQSINEIISTPSRISPYTGSSVTYNLVSQQIAKRWGYDEVKKYDPYNNTLTFAQWWKLGYRVKKGEKAIRSLTFVDVKDSAGNVVKKIKRGVCLFYCKQVEKRKL